jgi:CDP-glucose 4,6-dehydratase
MSYWCNKQVLVTGASGFLGGWLVTRLLREGARVVCIIRRPHPLSQFQIEHLERHTTIISGSAEDMTVVGGVIRRNSFDAAFHLASLPEVNAAFRDPRATITASVDTTLVLLEALRRDSPETIAVVVSSDKAYGAQTIPYREDQALNPRHPYEIAKATEDHIAQMYGRLYGLPVAVTRCGNYFGGYDFTFERIVPYTIRQILGNKAPLLRSDGQFTRDFLYVEEAARVHLMLAERLAKEPDLRGEAFNFSHELSITVIALVHKIAEIMGSNLRPVIGAGARSEIPHMRLDCTKARGVLGWVPEITFEDGLHRTINWYTNNLPRLESLLAERTRSANL